MKRRRLLQSLLGLLAAPLAVAGTSRRALGFIDPNPRSAALGATSPSATSTDTAPAGSGRGARRGSGTGPRTSADSARPGAAAPTRSATATSARPRRLLLQESPLAGFQFHAGEWLWPWLSVGASLALVREASNPHDERAVAVNFAGHRIGYVPRIDNAAVSQLLDRGERLSARVVALRESRDPWQRLRLAIDWEPST